MLCAPKFSLIPVFNFKELLSNQLHNSPVALHQSKLALEAKAEQYVV